MVNIIFHLFTIFFKLGFTTFGGGYAMITLIEHEITSLVINLGVNQNVLESFANLGAISGMMPGPIAINAATYVGYMCAGVWGAIASTIAICLPAFIIMLTISAFFDKFKKNEPLNNLLSGIRPAAIGLIATAVIYFAEKSLYNKNLINLHLFENLRSQPLSVINPAAIIIFILSFMAIKKFKFSPILITVAAGILGAFFCS